MPPAASDPAQPRTRPDRVALAMLAGTMLFWAGNFIVARAVRGDVPPVLLAFLRWAGASAILLPIAWRGFVADLPALRAGWRSVGLLGLVGIAMFNTIAYHGLRTTTATNGLLMQSSIPGILLLLGALFLGRRERAGRVLGIALSMTGAAFTIFRGDPHALVALDLGEGDLLIFIACVLWAIYTLTLPYAPKVRPGSLLLATFLLGLIVLVPVVLLVPEPAPRWTPMGIAGVAYVAIFPSLVAYYLYNAAVARAGPAIAGQAITLMPPVGAILAALILAEPLHWYHGVGLALIAAGIALSVRSDLSRA